MGILFNNLPEGFPDYLKFDEQTAPVPTWEQVTRSTQYPNEMMIAHVSRIIADTEDESVARARWQEWPGSYRRSVALLVDKICNEGWLDRFGPIKNGWPWDGGCFFWPRKELAELLGNRGDYVECSIETGLFAYLNAWNHKGWQKAWMETDAAMAALHIGLFEDGSAEVHMEAFNPLYINGAPRSDIVEIPLLGAFNHAMFQLHRRWEQSEYAPLVRNSANFYHMMRGVVPLSF